MPIHLLLLSALLILSHPTTQAQAPAALSPAKPVACPAVAQSCANYDALVFVHGIYGNKGTFENPRTKFSWPREIPPRFRGRQVDVFSLNYQTELISWARSGSPNFKDLNAAVFEVLKPLRMREYRSIGFVAHSLGGNVVSSYIHFTKTSRSHPASSQHAYVITLATPVLGAQIADLGSIFKSALGMSDPLLESLTKNNLFLEMLLEFRKAEGPKRELYGCRAINLHAAYEEKYLGPFLVVTRDSSEASVTQLASSPIVGFRLDHSEIAKPSDSSHEVYRWVNQKIDDEFVRLSAWDKAVSMQPTDKKLCVDIPFKPEG